MLSIEKFNIQTQLRVKVYDPTIDPNWCTRNLLSMDQLQIMITNSIQVAMPTLEYAIATKVTDTLQVRGKLVCVNNSSSGMEL